MQETLLDLCGYGHDKKSLETVDRVSKNYSEFDELVKALTKLEFFLKHSNYYLSLMSERDMIQIKTDIRDEDEEFFTIDSEISVWANENKVEIEEGFNAVCIIGFKQD